MVRRFVFHTHLRRELRIITTTLDHSLMKGKTGRRASLHDTEIGTKPTNLASSGGSGIRADEYEKLIKKIVQPMLLPRNNAFRYIWSRPWMEMCPEFCGDIVLLLESERMKSMSLGEDNIDDVFKPMPFIHQLWPPFLFVFVLGAGSNAVEALNPNRFVKELPGLLRASSFD